MNCFLRLVMEQNWNLPVRGANLPDTVFVFRFFHWRFQINQMELGEPYFFEVIRMTYKRVYIYVSECDFDFAGCFRCFGNDQNVEHMVEWL